MAMEINIRITLDGDTEYSATEAAVVRSLAAHPSQGAAAVTEWPPAPEKAAQAPKAEAPKAEAPKARATRAPKAAAAKPTPEPDVPMALDVDPVDDTPAPEAPADEAPAAEAAAPTGLVTHIGTLKLTQPAKRDATGAVSAATELVSKGKTALVKAALDAAGAKKVSGLETDEDIATFFAALEG